MVGGVKNVPRIIQDSAIAGAALETLNGAASMVKAATTFIHPSAKIQKNYQSV